MYAQKPVKNPSDGTIYVISIAVPNRVRPMTEEDFVDVRFAGEHLYQKIDIDALYDTKQGSKYWYKGGFSRAAIIALVCGSAASFPVLSLSWMIGLPLSFVLYIILRKAGVDRVAQESP